MPELSIRNVSRYNRPTKCLPNPADIHLDQVHLRELALGVLDIPESEDKFFTLAKPPGDAVIPLPPYLATTYVLKWANPTRIGAGEGAAYSLDLVPHEPGRARTRHLYITYMDEAGPSRCRVALAKAIQQLGPILYTAEEDARESPTVFQVRSGIFSSAGPRRSSAVEMAVDMDIDMDVDMPPLPLVFAVA